MDSQILHYVRLENNSDQMSVLLYIPHDVRLENNSDQMSALLSCHSVADPPGEASKAQFPV